MPTDHEMKEIADRIQMLASCFVPGSRRFGVSDEMLNESDPFASIEELTEKEAIALLQQQWSDGLYGEIGTGDVAVEAFIFGCSFGHSITAWLLSEAFRMEKVDRSYVMTEPPAGIELTSELAKQISGRGQEILQPFRNLKAGYVGWLTRVARTAS